MENKRQQFYKYSALGNDYVVIDPQFFSAAEDDLTKEMIQKICDVHYGVGSDGILFGPIVDKKKQQDQSYFFRIYNPDGSEAEKSGNGIRIFAKYLKDAGYIKSPKNNFQLLTVGGDVFGSYLNEAGTIIKVHMGKRIFHKEKINHFYSPRFLHLSDQQDEILNYPLDVQGQVYSINFVSMGNPHCVLFTDECLEVKEKKISAEEWIKKLGPILEHHPAFPQRTNVQLVEVLSRNEISIHIWERGAGYTFASGSSSCAAAAVAQKRGLVGDSIKVHMPGGTMEIQIDAHDDGVWLTGSVYGIARGEFLTEFLEQNFSG